MEKDTDKQKNIRSAESELDFLIKQQQKELSSTDSKFRVLKISAIAFLVLIIVGTLVFIGNFYMSDVRQVAQNENRTGTGVFNPSQYGVISEPIQGKVGQVFYSFQEDINPQEQYELLDDDNNRIAFIYSTTNDLSLLLDIEVEIEGELRRRTSEGYDVILVRSLILKRE